eukprot:TRINITY_DN1740_c0_g1_i2.p1 TRINITY_DN1740_c0_g1~~TRINITY_DN1740_c0_g1_i2.p1  ORF type:complete len:456 (+),score=65.14 TRINITY_DN1740_c0_g1_i2:87-1454(+)
MKALTPLLFLVVLPTIISIYTPDWPSLDSRPNPDWWNEAKFTLFMHWGIYSVPSYCSPVTDSLLCYAEWYWIYSLKNGSAVQKFHNDTYGPNFKYQSFVNNFKAELFDPEEWASIFKSSGAKGLVMTSKHHEGYTLWPSNLSWNWNSVDNPPHRNLVADLSTAVRNAGLRMGYYYSLYEWFHPLYIGGNPKQYVEEIMIPQLYDLVLTYKPDVLYVDGEWDHDSDFWETKPFLAWLFNESPVKDVVAINDRWGNDCRGKHGGYFVCEYSAFKGCPPNGDMTHPWTAHRGMGQSFGYNRIDVYNNVSFFIHLLVDSVSHGGHLQLNVGPTADGRIPEVQKQILLSIGEWLQVNGEAIYSTTVWRVPQDTQTNTTFYTQKKGIAVYAISIGWPGDVLVLSGVSVSNIEKVSVTMLGYQQPLSLFTNAQHQLGIYVPKLTEVLSCKHAWVFKITGDVS